MMGSKTNISWTDFTFNPWWGCFKVSAGCTNCYADTLATRWGHKIWGPPATTPRRMFGAKHWDEPLAWNEAARADGIRRRVFCASMADVFEDHPMVVAERERLWTLIESTPWLDWLLLTKRPENIGRMLPDHYWANVWLGTSTEDQEQADKRIPLLLANRDRAPVLFLSMEPQIGLISLVKWLSPGRGTTSIGGVQAERGIRVPGGAEWRSAYKAGRDYLASQETRMGSLERHDGESAMQNSESGTRLRGVLSDSDHARSRASLRPGAQVGLPLFRGPNPTGPDDQSHRREQETERSVQSRTGDLLRTAAPRDPLFEGGSRGQSVRRTELDGETNHGAGNGNSSAARGWREANPDSNGFRDFNADGIEDLQRRPLDASNFWVITGGESGAHHRPFDPDWARVTRNECAAAGVAWHFKQHGGRTHAEGGCLIDGREYKEFPAPLVPK